MVTAPFRAIFAPGSHYHGTFSHGGQADLTIFPSWMTILT